MKKVGIAARLLAVVAILSMAAFAVAGCGDDKGDNSSNGNDASGSASGGGLDSGDTVGESGKVVIGSKDDLDAQQKEIAARLGEFADATVDKDYKKLCDDLLSKEASKIGGDCEKTFSQTGSTLKDFKITVNSVEMGKDGKTATAAISVTSNVNKAPQEQNVSMIKEGGDWRIQILGQ